MIINLTLSCYNTVIQNSLSLFILLSTQEILKQNVWSADNTNVRFTISSPSSSDQWISIAFSNTTNLLSTYIIKFANYFKSFLQLGYDNLDGHHCCWRQWPRQSFVEDRSSDKLKKITFMLSYADSC